MHLGLQTKAQPDHASVRILTKCSAGQATAMNGARLINCYNTMARVCACGLRYRIGRRERARKVARKGS